MGVREGRLARASTGCAPAAAPPIRAFTQIDWGKTPISPDAPHAVAFGADRRGPDARADLVDEGAGSAPCRRREPGPHDVNFASRLAFLAFASIACAVPALGHAAVSVTTGGNNASISIALPGGVEADMSLGFSNANNLDAASLGASAQLVSVTDLGLLARLPDSSLLSIPAAFPVLVEIAAPASGGLSFEDSVRAEIHTHELVWAPGSRLRLFKAPAGGAFADITEAVEAGSVRTRGRTGGFSQFLVLLDLRPTSDVVELKLDALEDRLDAAAGLDASQRALLDAMLDDVRAAWDDGLHGLAIAAVEQLDAEVRQLAGTVLANAWRAQRDLANDAGDLQALAATLRFSIAFHRDHGD